MRTHRQAGGGLAAVFPIHNPRALLRAFDLLPVEVWGPPGVETTAGDAHLQAYTCSIVRCGLSFLLDGGLDQADVVMVPHACDSLQGLGSVLLDFVKPRQPVLPFYLPRGRDAGHVEFLAAELRAIGARLEETTGRHPGDAELHACLDREERADAGLGRLLAARAAAGQGGGPSNRDFYRLVRSREYLPAESFADHAETLLADDGAASDGTARGEAEPAAPAAADGRAAASRRVVLSGLVPEPLAVLEALDEVGLTVVGDDLACCGRRLYLPSSDPDPYRRLAASMLAAPPDSTRGDAVADRRQHLLALAQRGGAGGVIFFDVKFCEPELFYLPQLERGLKKAGLRTLLLEVDISDSLPHQVTTRIEAFAESLQ